MLGLVLSGGAAKGYAHIGFIRLLEELDIRPDLIVGASMGSLVGGFYAAGYNSSKITAIALKIDKKLKRHLFKFHFSKRGFIDGRNIIKFLTPYLGGINIENLPIRYAAVATDIEENSEVIIDRGSLIQAIRSSISIPVLFVPNRLNGHILIDGGFVNPIPVDVAKKLGAKKIIAVNVLPRFEYPQNKIGFKDPTGKGYNIKEVFIKTFDLISSRLIDYGTRYLEDGILIDIDTREIRMSQFEKAKQAIEIGYIRSKTYKKALQSLL